MPIIIPFLKENNLSFGQILQLQSIHALTMILIEVPSGYFSDRLGRKTTLIIGTGLGTIGFYLFSEAHLFWQFLVGNLFIGLGDSFISGTDSALLFDSLQEVKRTKEYTKFESRTVSLGSFAEALAALVGGWLAIQFGALRITYVAQTLLAAFSFITALTLLEPQQTIKNKKVTFIESIDSAIGLWQYSKLKWTIIISSLTGVSTLLMAWFAQELFEYNDIALKWYHYLWFGLNFIVGFFAWHAWKLELIIGKNKAFKLLVLTIPLLFFAVLFKNVLIFISIITLFYALRGLATPILRNHIQQLSQDHLRATVMSVRSLIIRTIFFLAAAGLGTIQMYVDTKMLLFITGAFLTISSFIAYRKLLQ